MGQPIFVRLQEMRAIGAMNALYLAHLCSQTRGFSPEDGYSFILTLEQQAQDLKVSKHTIRERKKEMVNMGFLTTKLVGVPAKEMYTLHMENIKYFFFENDQKEAQKVREGLKNEHKNSRCNK